MGMYIRHRHPSKNARATHFDIQSPSKPQRRWRLAFQVVYFMVSLPRKRIKNVSHVSIEIASDSHETLSIDNDAIIESPPSSSPPLIDQKTPTSMTKSKDPEALSLLGGPHNLAPILSANDDIIGISSNNIPHLLNRKREYGTISFSSHDKPLNKPILSFVIQAFVGIPTLVQVLFAVFILVFDIKLYGREHGWYDGGGILISVFLTLAFSAIIKFKHSQVLDQLSNKIGNIKVVQALRNGCPKLISISEIVVGDVIFLKTGDYIPADGFLLDGVSFKVITFYKDGQVEEATVNADAPYLLSGSKVVDGYGKMLVTSVFENITTFQNKDDDIDQISSHHHQPLQARIENLNFYITMVGVIVAILHLVVLEVRYFTGATKDQHGNRAFKGKEMNKSDVVSAVIKHISSALTIGVASIPEGLPLAVRLALSCSMKMMSSLRILMQLARWENIGSISVICTDKTGILTIGEMDVSEFWVGKDKVERSFKKKLAIGLDQLLQESIGLNTSGGVTGICSSESMPQVYGSPTEKALLKWGISELGINMDDLSTSFEVSKVEAYNSERKSSGVMVRRKRDQRVLLHFKGPAKVILANCSDYYNQEGKLITMGDKEKKTFTGIINKMGETSSLTCIAFACKQIDQADFDRNMKQLEETGLSLLALVGLKDQYQRGISEAVELCKDAGVSVKLITGDDITTAKAIATEIGIFNEIGNSDAVIEGTEFRKYSPEQRSEKVDKIKVLASASPNDKLIMVQQLKQKGHVVALMDDGTNKNASALEEADIGLIMVTESTQVIAKGSDIVVLDGNFSSIVTILRWGRCLLNNIRKVIQVQLTITAVGCISSSIIAAVSGTVPLLWANMMVDTLAALALATEEPIGKNDDLMKKKAKRKADQGNIIVTKEIWRNIIGQTMYQVIVLLTIQYKGKSIFGVDDGVRNTLIFNCFVFLQVFNECNARRVEKKNIFEGILENKLFWGIIGFTIALQVIMVELLCKFSNTQRLNAGQWAACVAVGALCLPVGWLVKCIPIHFSDG